MSTSPTGRTNSYSRRLRLPRSGATSRPSCATAWVNFNGLIGPITHSHNRYDRIGAREKSETTPTPDRRDFPVEFIRSYTQRLLEDYGAGRMRLPTDLSTTRTPRAL